MLYCDSTRYSCDTFWVTYPGIDDIIYWPIPPSIKKYIPVSIYGNAQISGNPVKNTFSIAVLLEYTLDGVSTKMFDRNALTELEMRFVEKIVNKDGEPVLGSFKASFVESQCNYDGFVVINDEENSLITLLAATTDQIELNTLRYRLGNLKMHFAF